MNLKTSIKILCFVFICLSLIAGCGVKARMGLKPVSIEGLSLSLPLGWTPVDQKKIAQAQIPSSTNQKLVIIPRKAFIQTNDNAIFVLSELSIPQQKKISVSVVNSFLDSTKKRLQKVAEVREAEYSSAAGIFRALRVSDNTVIVMKTVLHSGPSGRAFQLDFIVQRASFNSKIAAEVEQIILSAKLN